LLDFPRGFTLLKKMIVKPTALIKNALHSGTLFVRGIYPILVSFKHYCYYSLNRKYSQRGIQFIPSVETQGILG
jgi:hypothetical protein